MERVNITSHALPNVFSQFSMVWGLFATITTRYRQIYKISILFFLKKLTVTRGTPFFYEQSKI